MGHCRVAVSLTACPCKGQVHSINFRSSYLRLRPEQVTHFAYLSLLYSTFASLLEVTSMAHNDQRGLKRSCSSLSSKNMCPECNQLFSAPHLLSKHRKTACSQTTARLESLRKQAQENEHARKRRRTGTTLQDGADTVKETGPQVGFTRTLVHISSPSMEAYRLHRVLGTCRATPLDFTKCYVGAAGISTTAPRHHFSFLTTSPTS